MDRTAELIERMQEQMKRLEAAIDRLEADLAKPEFEGYPDADHCVAERLQI